jgi:hypothetical protein
VSDEIVRCKLCGEPMPKGKEMFFYHGYSGDCPKPPLPKATASENDNYIAWMRISGEGTRQGYSLCDSDAEGAFKVYRFRQAAVPVVGKDEPAAKMRCEKHRKDAELLCQQPFDMWGCRECQIEAASMWAAMENDPITEFIPGILGNPVVGKDELRELLQWAVGEIAGITENGQPFLWELDEEGYFCAYCDGDDVDSPEKFIHLDGCKYAVLLAALRGTDK